MLDRRQRRDWRGALGRRERMQVGQDARRLGALARALPDALSGGSRVDAVTSATLSQHSVTWNLTDATVVPVQDGDYRVIVQVTDSRRD